MLRAILLGSLLVLLILLIALLAVLLFALIVLLLVFHCFSLLAADTPAAVFGRPGGVFSSIFLCDKAILPSIHRFMQESAARSANICKRYYVAARWGLL